MGVMSEVVFKEVDRSYYSQVMAIFLSAYKEIVIRMNKLDLDTVNREIFVYENIHVLNIHVNKFSRVPHKNVLTRKFVKLKLLCTYH